MQVHQRLVAGGDLRAVLLSNTLPGVDGFLAGQVVERLGTKPLTPVTVPFAAVTSDASAAKVFWYGQAAKHLWNDVVKRSATGAQLLVAVRATVVTAKQYGITPPPLRLLPRNQHRPIDLVIH